MSSVPPNIAGTILQSHITQRQVANIHQQERTQRANADRQQRFAIDEKDSTVETTDDDTQIHADAEGTGSQGRAFSEPEQPGDEAADGKPPRARTNGDSGRHIDLEA